MQSPSTVKDAPVETFTPDVETHDVSRLTSGVTDMLGPVVISGRISADCFMYPARELQAGAKEEAPTLESMIEGGPGKIKW